MDRNAKKFKKELKRKEKLKKRPQTQSGHSNYNSELGFDPDYNSDFDIDSKTAFNDKSSNFSSNLSKFHNMSHNEIKLLNKDVLEMIEVLVFGFVKHHDLPEAIKVFINFVNSHSQQIPSSFKTIHLLKAIYLHFVKEQSWSYTLEDFIPLFELFEEYKKRNLFVVLLGISIANDKKLLEYLSCNITNDKFSLWPFKYENISFFESHDFFGFSKVKTKDKNILYSLLNKNDILLPLKMKICLKHTTSFDINDVTFIENSVVKIIQPIFERKIDPTNKIINSFNNFGNDRFNYEKMIDKHISSFRHALGKVFKSKTIANLSNKTSINALCALDLELANIGKFIHTSEKSFMSVCIFLKELLLLKLKLKINIDNGVVSFLSTSDIAPPTPETTSTLIKPSKSTKSKSNKKTAIVWSTEQWFDQYPNISEMLFGFHPLKYLSENKISTYFQKQFEKGYALSTLNSLNKMINIKEMPIESRLKFEINKLKAYENATDDEIYRELLFENNSWNTNENLNRTYMFMKQFDKVYSLLSTSSQIEHQKIRLRLKDFFILKCRSYFYYGNINIFVFPKLLKDYPYDYKLNLLAHLNYFICKDLKALNDISRDILTSRSKQFVNIDTAILRKIIFIYFKEKSQLKEVSALFYKPISLEGKIIFFHEIEKIFFKNHISKWRQTLKVFSLPTYDYNQCLLAIYKYFEYPCLDDGSNIIVAEQEVNASNEAGMNVFHSILSRYLLSNRKNIGKEYLDKYPLTLINLAIKYFNSLYENCVNSEGKLLLENFIDLFFKEYKKISIKMAVAQNLLSKKSYAKITNKKINKNNIFDENYCYDDDDNDYEETDIPFNFELEDLLDDLLYKMNGKGGNSKKKQKNKYGENECPF
ncbi:MAG: hypothetical protein HQK51_16300 [Oligoflexia bacterium]|nr:hypothetical protein [Oligoflexia bacterium]